VFYEDFTCIYQIHLYRDSTYQITYRVRDLGSGNCSGFSNVWIDYNGDGILNNTNERLLSGQSYFCPTMFFNITVPNNTPLDIPLRMRIAAGENNVPTMCSTLCGQYEDYTIFIHQFPFTNVELPDDQTDFKIYPNPGTGIFNLDAIAGTFEVFDLNGKLQLRKEHAGKLNTLNLSEFENGVYMVALKNLNNVKWKKIILLKD
jgi:hypothetical protein